MKKNWIKIIFFVLILLVSGTNLRAQGVGSWKYYMAYQNSTLVAETPNKVFSAYDGSLLSYSPEDGSVKKYTKQDGLSDVGIKFIAYSADAEALVLVYENSNIDILTSSGFTNISSLKDEINLQKTVNNLEIDGSTAYLSTAFGVVVLDLKKAEIKATYKLNKVTRSICRFGQYLYAATTQGVYQGLITSNLLDADNWKFHHFDTGGDDKNVMKVLVFKNVLVFWQTGVGLMYEDSNGACHVIDQSIYRQIEVMHDQLVLVGSGYVSFYQDLKNSNFIRIDAQRISSLKDKNVFWVAGGLEGLTGIRKETNSYEYTVAVSGIKINSPKRNFTYSLTYAQNKLLVTGGGRGANRNDIKGTLMVYENKEWYNFNEDSIARQTGFECKDLMSAIVDPRDANHYFVSSWGEGVYEFQDNRLVQLFNPVNKNTTLASADPGDNRFVRTDGMAFDKEYNLYVTNSGVQNAINIYSAGKEWSNLYYFSLAGVTSQCIVIDRNNQKWVNSPRVPRIGLTVFDDKAGAVAYSGSFVDQQGYNIDASGYFSIAEDLNGTIWVGTDNGPIYFNNPSQVQDGKCTRVIAGGSTNPYRLMEGVKVTSIAVDGGNRKWFGTEGNGVFCVDMSTEDVTTQNFTTENSLLISNNINSIAIDNNSGEIFIATDQGLVSYMGEATAGKTSYSNVYAYPNPVRPETDSQVVITGLMSNSTVKITDLNGNLITQGTSAGGQFVWNCKKRTGGVVASGIYLVLASTPEGNKGVVTKIMVIK